jgi:hypothetical protein
MFKTLALVLAASVLALALSLVLWELFVLGTSLGLIQ